MRKVLSFVLVLSLILGSFSFAFGAGATSEFTDVKDTTAEGPVAVLSALDVINGYPDGTFKPEKVVTRAEMSKLVVRALGMESYVAGMYTTFGDAKGHWAENYVAWCSSYGIVEGYPDGTFKPNNTVTLQQAVTMIVRALGYQDQYLTGTWPTSHVSMAMSLDILEDIVATTAGATRGDVAKMLYNALDCSLINYDSSGNLAVTGDSMLKRLGAYEFEQVVQRQDVIDAAIDINDYLGAHAKFWAIDADKDKETGIYDEYYGENTKYECIVAIEEQISTMLTGDFTVADEEFVVGSKTYEFKNDAYDDDEISDWFYNGSSANADMDEVKGDWNAADEDTFTIAAKVSGNYITKIYSVLEWDATKEVQWDDDCAADLEDDQEIEGLEFALDDDDAIDAKTFALRGAEALDKIAEDDVVTVYANKAEEITKVEVSNKTVVGEVSKVSSDATKKYTIDGTKYVISTASVLAPFDAGDEGTFYLNYNGDIAFYDADGYAGNYAVITTEAGQDGAFSKAYKIELLTKDGEMSVFEFNKKDDGSTFENAAANVEGNVVEFDTNAAGKITDIEDADNLVSGNGKKLSSKKTLAGRSVVDDVVVFVLDTAGADVQNSAIDDIDNCYVGTLADVAVDETFANNNLYYGLNKDDKVDVIVVKYDSAANETEKTMGFITAYGTAKNADGDNVYDLDVLIDGVAKSYQTEDRSDIALITGAGNTTSLFKFSFRGDVISDVKLAAVEANDEVKTEFATGKDAVGYVDASIQNDSTTVGSIKAYVVTERKDTKLNFGVDASDDPINQWVDGAKFYKGVLSKDKTTIKNFEVAKLSDMSRDGGVVVLLQLDEDSDNWDTVLFLTADDYAKYVEANTP